MAVGHLNHLENQQGTQMHLMHLVTSKALEAVGYLKIKDLITWALGHFSSWALEGHLDS